MDNRINNKDGREPGAYIWLRYATQFTANGRSFTVEMNVPMPVGASTEQRERLLNEAEDGMDQLADRVESRATQMLHRMQSQPSSQSQQGKSAPSPVTRPSPQYRPASTPAPQTGPHPLQSVPGRTRENVPEPPVTTHEVGTTPSRSNISSSMPSTSGMTGDNLSLKQFISHIRENMDLSPGQAMEHLKIKTLSGINLREALEQLQRQVGRKSSGTTGPLGHDAASSGPSATRPGPAAIPNITSSASSMASANSFSSSSLPTERSVPAPGGIERTGLGDVHEEAPTYRFDEEIGPEDNEDFVDDLEDFPLPHEFTMQERVQANNKRTALREIRGNTPASAGRLVVLTNVISDQITAEQLHDMIQGVWDVASLKKLKVDQVEALITWAKEDDFTSEVEALLEIIKED